MPNWSRILGPLYPHARWFRHYLLYRVGRRPAISPTSPEEQAALARHATGKRRLAEIGVFHGATTLRLRQVMDPQGVLLAVDPYAGGGAGWCRRIAHCEVAKCSRGAVIWLETTGAAAVFLPSVRPHLPIDFLYIDGDHSWESIAGDWSSWSGHIAPGGIVALHDSVPALTKLDSARFTQEVILPDLRFVCVEIAYRLTILQRR